MSTVRESYSFTSSKDYSVAVVGGNGSRGATRVTLQRLVLLSPLASESGQRMDFEAKLKVGTRVVDVEDHVPVKKLREGALWVDFYLRGGEMRRAVVMLKPKANARLQVWLDELEEKGLTSNNLSGVTMATQKNRTTVKKVDGEWQVRVYIDGKYDENKSYFAMDKQDALDTQREMNAQLARDHGGTFGGLMPGCRR